MRAILSATALAGALALMPIAALAQQTPGQPGTPETQATPPSETQPGQTPETQATEAPASGEFRVISSADELEGLETAEVRIDPVEEVPRDMIPAINAALDPANQQATALRERLEEHEGVKQALTEEDVEIERVVGAAVDENDLVVYILPEGQTREKWGAQMPAPSGAATPGGADNEAPGATGATGTDQPSGGAGAAGGQQPSSGGSNY